MQNNYNIDFYEKIASVERKHFWFLHRAKVIDILLGNLIRFKTFKMLEIGAGTCFVSGTICKRYEGSDFYCLDLNVEGLKIGRQHFPVKCLVGDITKDPFKINFNIIGVFDVLEHLEDDEMLLKNAIRFLEKNGIVVLTVPAYDKLWSDFDVVSGHKRRYSKRELLNKLRKNNYEPIIVSYFNTFLLPIMFLVRKKKKHENGSYCKEMDRQLNPSFIINMIMNFVNRFERFLLKIGVKLPIGTSIIIVAKRNDD